MLSRIQVRRYSTLKRKSLTDIATRYVGIPCFIHGKDYGLWVLEDIRKMEMRMKEFDGAYPYLADIDGLGTLKGLLSILSRLDDIDIELSQPGFDFVRALNHTAVDYCPVIKGLDQGEMSSCVVEVLRIE